MNVLILGGTQFVGRHIADALLSAGHSVSLFNRGSSPDELPATIERIRGDRDEGAAGLGALAGRKWDACIDVSGYTARQVRPAAELLRDRVNRYVFVSAVSVFGDPKLRPVLETHPRQAPADEGVTEVNGETYGPLKVTCENIVREIYGERSTFLRPQVVVGPYDPSSRYSYWVQRAAKGDEMLAPGDGSDHLQMIDARDVGRFAVSVVEHDLTGPFNLSGPGITWSEFLKILGAQNLVWVPKDIIRDAGFTEFDLPLYRSEHGPRSGLMDVSHERAEANGLRLTSPETTLRDFRVWLAGKEMPSPLSPEREAELIRLSRQVRSA